MVETIGVGLAIGMVTAWAGFAVLLWVIARRQQIRITAALQVLPDTLSLMRALARDRSLPNAIRWRLAFALVYCGQPFNLIPDFIPVIGYADNVVVAAWALRSVIRLSGPESVSRHWPGSTQGLELLCKALRIRSSSIDTHGQVNPIRWIPSGPNDPDLRPDAPLGWPPRATSIRSFGEFPAMTERTDSDD